MRKFNFDIDDWTGGNTLSNDMGNAVASTVGKMLFSVVTKPTNKFSFYNNNVVPIKVCWGDTGEYYPIKEGEVSYNYPDNNMEERTITFSTNANLDNIITYDLYGTQSFINIETDIESYIIYGTNSKGALGRYLESNVNTIGELVFANDNIVSINPLSFQLLKFESDVIIPDSVNNIGSYAFSDATINGDLIIPDTTTNIEENAFDSAKIHGDFELPSSNTIKKNSFRYISLDYDLIIPDTVETIEEFGFFQLELEGIIMFGSGLKRIEANAFANPVYINNSLDFNDGLEYIGARAFYNCYHLQYPIKFPSSLVEIGPAAFYGCLSVGNFIFNEGLKTIHNNAFSDCKALRNDMVLPESLEYIGEDAFNCNVSYKHIVIYVCEDTIMETQKPNKFITFITYKRGEKPIL